jgi:predicted nucleic acid-binding protein
MFVDTGGWYAAYVLSDPDHTRVTPLIDGPPSRLITTDLVLAESLNLLRARDEYQRAIVLGRELLAGGAADLINVTLEDLQRALVIFETYRDKAWSFTDCSSLVVMQRLGIREAISLDQHFRQMPGITVFP